MSEVSPPSGNKRPDGTFGPGNTIGNRFGPGQSGNPSGRPKYGAVSAAIRAILELEPGEVFEPKTNAELIAWQQVQSARDKERHSIDFVTNRAEGLPVARQHVKTDREASLLFEAIEPESAPVEE